MIINSLKLWWFWHVTQPHKKDKFKFKNWYFKKRISNKGNLCLDIFNKKCGYLTARLVVNNGQMTVTYFGHHAEKSKTIYTMYDMRYGRNNFLKDPDAYNILCKVVYRLNHYAKDKWIIKETDYREACAQLDRLVFFT